MDEIRVIEVDQWTSTGDIASQDFDTVTLWSVRGGDSSAAKAIFGGHFVRKTVPVTASPAVGNVWFRKGPNGKCEFLKANYDSSG